MTPASAASVATDAFSAARASVRTRASTRGATRASPSLRRALRLIASRRPGTLAEIALDAGYYDQAHMNADFRALAGRPPLAFAPPPASPSASRFHSSKTGRGAGRTLRP